MGFAHHSHYLNYFEMARIEWLNSIGFSYAKLERSGIIMPVVFAEVNFKSPSFFDDSLRIKLTIDKIPKASIKIDYVIINETRKTFIPFTYANNKNQWKQIQYNLLRNYPIVNEKAFKAKVPAYFKLIDRIIGIIKDSIRNEYTDPTLFVNE